MVSSYILLLKLVDISRKLNLMKNLQLMNFLLKKFRSIRKIVYLRGLIIIEADEFNRIYRIKITDKGKLLITDLYNESLKLDSGI